MMATKKYGVWRYLVFMYVLLCNNIETDNINEIEKCKLKKIDCYNVLLKNFYN